MMKIEEMKMGRIATRRRASCELTRLHLLASHQDRANPSLAEAAGEAAKACYGGSGCSHLPHNLRVVGRADSSMVAWI